MLLFVCVSARCVQFYVILLLPVINSSCTLGKIWSKQNILPLCASRSSYRRSILSCWKGPNPEGLESCNNWKALWSGFVFFSSVDYLTTFKLWGKTIIQVLNAICSMWYKKTLYSELSTDHYFTCLSSRIDHLLGRNTIENLAVLRFSNLVFMPLWNRSYIHNIQVICLG